MKVAIMQPYLFPYIGYFQLISTADVFVLHDDVQWIKGGWINRNQILLDGRAMRWTLPVAKASSLDLINQCEVAEAPNGKERVLRQVKNAYGRAPFFAEVMPLIENILNQSERNIAKYISYSLYVLCGYLGVTTTQVMSSSLDKNDSLRREQRVINICLTVGGTEYINPSGGQELYSKKNFKDAGIDLHFLQPQLVEYQQYNGTFVPGLSIIDVLMFNSDKSVREMLNLFTLI